MARESLQASMKTIKLSREEASALCEALRDYIGANKELVESARYKIFLEPDDTVMFMELIDSKPAIEPEEEDEEEDEDIESCEQCGEHAWDGYICHACGLKHI